MREFEKVVKLSLLHAAQAPNLSTAGLPGCGGGGGA